MYNNKDYQKYPLSLLGERGFTLPELLVVMAIFIIVIMIASDCFKTILTRSSLLSKSAESNIEGIVGLEMFRHDLNQAGFGLPWGFYNATPPTYGEAVDEGDFEPSLYNDAPNGVPRAVVAGNDVADGGILDNTDYLALKGTTLSRNNASQRWTYVNYSSSGSTKPKIWSSENLADNDRVIVMRRAFTEAGYVNQLVTTASAFYTTYSKNGLGADFSPQVPQDNYYIYGISSDKDPRMPFNRTDYFVKRPAGIAAGCAPNTGVLYKEMVNHNGGTMTEIPVLDCVADMQVVFGWDMSDDGVVDVYSSADGSDVSAGDAAMIASVKATMADAALVRSRLKLIKVFLLVQDGRKDPTFKNTQDIVVGNVGEVSLTNKFDVAEIDFNKWTNYRWKVYRIVVSPKNLALK